MENKVVAHMRDGSIQKGITHDFRPDAEAFHLLPAFTAAEGRLRGLLIESHRRSRR